MKVQYANVYERKCSSKEKVYSSKSLHKKLIVEKCLCYLLLAIKYFFCLLGLLWPSSTLCNTDSSRGSDFEI